MEIAVTEEGAFAVAPAVSPEEARGRVAAYSTGAFGGIAQFFSKPKPDELAIEVRGLRYRPLWNARAHVRYAFDRRESYRFPIKSPDHVVGLTIGETQFALEGDKKERTIAVAAIAHCLRETHKEIWVDALSGETIPAPRFGTATPEAIDLSTFAPENAQVAEPAIRASAIVRMVLGDDVVPPEADAVSEARAEIDKLDAYFLPLYAFSVTWTTKNKTVEVECDALTGEVSQQKAALHPVFGKLLTKETLFDLGGETLNLVLPGSAIPLKIVQALSKKHQH